MGDKNEGSETEEVGDDTDERGAGREEARRAEATGSRAERFLGETRRIDGSWNSYSGFETGRRVRDR